MASSINATTTSGVVTTADNSGILNLQSNGVTQATVTSTGMTVPNSMNIANTFGFKNRLINGNMTIDQRNAGASVNNGQNNYTLDRWASYGSQNSKFTIQQNAGSVTPPVGFKNYLGITSSSAYSVGASEFFFIKQPIEGYNIADFGWGTASAKTVTLSFWVYSSLTGTFGGSLWNSNATRCYPYTYTISSANTWQQISITISGDTSGTWQSTNGSGLNIGFNLGAGSTYSGTAGSWTGTEYYSATGATSVVGTNGATWYVTGVQFELGSQATSFDFRSYTTELSLCQRYYWKWISYISRSYITTSNCIGASNTYGPVKMPVTMRSNPTLTTSGTASDYGGYAGSVSFVCSAVPTMDTSNPETPLIQFPSASAYSVGIVAICGSATTNGFIGFNAEL